MNTSSPVEPLERDFCRSEPRQAAFFMRTGLAFPLLMLGLVTGVSGLLLLGHIGWTRQWRNLYLVWNLFLAWLPLGFALLVCHYQNRPATERWKLGGAAFGWLLFFPNAPYICTDLVHLGSKYHGHYWVDLALILLFALTGLVLGFLSLFLIHSLVARRWGGGSGWVFAITVIGLSGYGIYFGRFFRWNSWDVLVNPLGMMRDIVAWTANPPAIHLALVFPPLYALLVLLVYLMLYALTRLQSVIQTAPGDSAF